MYGEGRLPFNKQRSRVAAGQRAHRRMSQRHRRSKRTHRSLPPFPTLSRHSRHSRHSAPSAPSSSRSANTARWPWLAALYSGVEPAPLRASSPERPLSSCTAARWPPIAALCRGVSPSAAGSSGSLPAPSRAATMSAWPAAAAQCRGSQPSASLALTASRRVARTWGVGQLGSSVEGAWMDRCHGGSRGRRHGGQARVSWSSQGAGFPGCRCRRTAKGGRVHILMGAHLLHNFQLALRRRQVQRGAPLGLACGQSRVGRRVRHEVQAQGGACAGPQCPPASRAAAHHRKAERPTLPIPSAHPSHLCHPHPAAAPHIRGAHARWPAAPASARSDQAPPASKGSRRVQPGRGCTACAAPAGARRRCAPPRRQNAAAGAGCSRCARGWRPRRAAAPPPPLQGQRGCGGVGEIKAEKLLRSSSTSWHACKRTEAGRAIHPRNPRRRGALTMAVVAGPEQRRPADGVGCVRSAGGQLQEAAQHA